MTSDEQNKKNPLIHLLWAMLITLIHMKEEFLLRITCLSDIPSGPSPWQLTEHPKNMFSEPFPRTHVREEEPSCGVVGIGGGLAELVVDAVVPRPHVDRVLHGEAVDQHQEDAQGQARLVRAVRPQAVGSCCHALRWQTRGELFCRTCGEVSSMIRLGNHTVRFSG